MSIVVLVVYSSKTSREIDRSNSLPFSAVVQHALGQTVQKTCPEYNGPTLGIKQTDANVREWTPEQQEEQVRTRV